MKILEINVYNFKSGGSQTVYFNTIDGLRELGNEVIQFALKWDKNEPSEYSEYFPESKESRKGALKPVNNIVSYFYHFEAAKKLEKLIRDHKPDIAQIHLIWGQFSPSILTVLKKHRIPIVFTIHDYRLVCPGYLFLKGNGEVCEECQGKHFYKCISNTCCKGSKGLSAMMAAEQYFRNAFFNPVKYASGIVYVSNFAKAIHEKYMPSLKSLPSICLYNFASKIDENINKNYEKYFLYFGRLSREKGIVTLLDVFNKLPNLKLKLVGTGPEEEALRAKSREFGSDNIEFLGYKTGEELEKLVKSAYFVIVPSEWYENNPMTVVESYSLSTPVIGAKIGGIPEIVVEGKTGFTFESGSAESLIDAVKRSENLSKEQYESMRIDALDFAKKNFDKKKYMEKLLKFFKEIEEKK